MLSTDDFNTALNQSAVDFPDLTEDQLKVVFKVVSSIIREWDLDYIKKSVLAIERITS